ncbi:MAG TPA: hypothetical protein VFE02_05460 [Candidatus Acidoferrales bacterium]|nr:hypothetical protein [Candidatus Acidoferrales bacterium]
MSRENFPLKFFFATAVAFCLFSAVANGAGWSGVGLSAVAVSGVGSSLRGLDYTAFANLKPNATAADPANAPSVFTADKGRFRITINGQPVGTEEFEIAATGNTWLEHSSMTAHAPGNADIKSTGQLKLSADGSPVRYDWAAEALKKATGSVDFENGTAKCSADLGKPTPLRKDFKFTSSVIAVLDNNLYYQFAILARLYDWKTGGKQTFPVLIPQDMVPGSISVESLGQEQAGNGHYEALRVSSPDLEIMLYLDGNHRMMRLVVPSSNVMIERE